MGALATVRVNTTQKMILYRDFLIQEAYEPGEGNIWEWTHADYLHGAAPQFLSVTGACQTLFEAIEAVEDWYVKEPSNA